MRSTSRITCFCFKNTLNPFNHCVYSSSLQIMLRYYQQLQYAAMKGGCQMKNIQKVFSVFLALVLCMTVCVCANAEEYTATAKGFGGDVIVTLTVDGGTITDAAVTGDSETPAIGGAALDTLKSQLIEAQSAEIDGVAGATVTTNAVKAAAKTALDAANGVEVSSEIAYNAGTYTGNAFGMLGPITVEVSVSDNEITNVTVTSSLPSVRTTFLSLRTLYRHNLLSYTAQSS